MDIYLRSHWCWVFNQRKPSVTFISIIQCHFLLMRQLVTFMSVVTYIANITHTVFFYGGVVGLHFYAVCPIFNYCHGNNRSTVVTPRLHMIWGILWEHIRRAINLEWFRSFLSRLQHTFLVHLRGSWFVRNFPMHGMNFFGSLSFHFT